jgi:hypothetical protein
MARRVIDLPEPVRAEIAGHGGFVSIRSGAYGLIRMAVLDRDFEGEFIELPASAARRVAAMLLAHADDIERPGDATKRRKAA